eukprot:TRINITY_DN3486_c0_g1_i1.p1 TRINITY_DN3486_c0_g1~~TRINITY_DN3486_c0_g1_i1.p1  ORF type:complete len:211 (-),score=41.77 TRINITY_DN3486_c0_g1_i1:23-655(-)
MAPSFEMLFSCKYTVTSDKFTLTASAKAIAPSLEMLFSCNHNLLTVSFTFNSSVIIFASSSPIPQPLKSTNHSPNFNFSIPSYSQNNQYHPSTHFNPLSPLTLNFFSSIDILLFSFFFFVMDQTSLRSPLHSFPTSTLLFFLPPSSSSSSSSFSSSSSSSSSSHSLPLFSPAVFPCTTSILPTCPMIRFTTSTGNMFHSNPFNSSSSYLS